MNNVEIFEIKSFSLKKISLYIQIFLIICLAVALIVKLFIKDNEIVTLILYGILSLLMFVMSYNNKKFYKRKYMTYIYFGFGVILIGSIVVKLIW